ncbi:hypothetical protein CYMTET_8765 [Cymbomonas tetramitiformis]|uniref:Uncharacterized protein n=1 Tax=Cymbomonas tetramitiformis TaxID=36881 RepID=A0AAE0LFS5_9CHLO|nr:hypothetical protein CYMTET_8765 [Cymbomonas tetramitiformis]
MPNARLAAYTLAKIRNAKVVSRPYPHVYIQDVFSPSFYPCMLARLPRKPPRGNVTSVGGQSTSSSVEVSANGTAKAAIHIEQADQDAEDPQSPPADLKNTSKDVGNQTIDVDVAANREVALRAISGYNQLGSKISKRFVIQLLPKGAPKPKKPAPNPKGYDAKFWQSFSNHFATPALAHAWVQKFKSTVNKRFSSKRTRASYTYRMDLSRDISGYSIGPHSDTEMKWVTTLYYLPPTAEDSDVGTAVIQSLTGSLQKTGAQHKKWGPNWKIAYRAPYTPNSVLAFAPCWSSWHGVPPMREGVIRDTIQGFVRSSLRVTKSSCGK